MEEYIDIISHVLSEGDRKVNRTDEDTISAFNYNYSIDYESGFPLLTTKKMDTFRWDSMIYELEWYLSGKHHIRDLTRKTSLWDAWSDDNNNLPSAYGRFWRRYPVPANDAKLSGEDWISKDSPWVASETPIELLFDYENSENAVKELVDRVENSNVLNNLRVFFDKPREISKNGSDMISVPITLCTNSERETQNILEDVKENINPKSVELRKTYQTFDQLGFIVDALKGDNPHRSAKSRRLILQAWHPSNANVSSLPPCHFNCVFNVKQDRLNMNLIQRSGDVALGIPFNIAAYSILLNIVANQTGYKVGTFGHTIVDAHIYCGKKDKSQWYRDNIKELQDRLDSVTKKSEYEDIKKWIIDSSPEDKAEIDISNNVYGYDHIPGMIEQLSREPKSRPALSLSDDVAIHNFSEDMVNLRDYDSYSGMRFEVAE